MATWYYMSNNNERIGPLDDMEIREALSTGLLQMNSPVFKVGNREWNRAGDFPELLPIPAAPLAVASRLPWSVKNIINADSTWGSEVRFPEISPDELQAISHLLHQYTVIQSPLLPRVSSTADGRGLVFLFPPCAGGTEATLASFPMGDREVEALRVSLLHISEALHLHGLGIWDVDERLLFRADDQYLMIPAFWLPGLAGRNENIPGAAPEWRNAGSQPQADIYAIACACFAAVIGKEYDPASQPLPGDFLPAARTWDAVLDPALRQSPARRPKSVSEWLSNIPSVPARKLNVLEGSTPENISLCKNRQLYDESVTNSDDDVIPLERSVKNTSSSNAARNKRRLRNKKGRLTKIIVVLGLLTCVALAAHYLLDAIGVSIIPGTSSGFKRGFGSTILKYAPRSYENALWKEVWNIEQVPEKAYETAIVQVGGWDSDNIVLTMEHTGTFLFVWKRDGEWILHPFGGNTFSHEDGNRVIFQDKDTFFLSYPDGLHRITPIERRVFSGDKWDRVNHDRSLLGNFDTDSLWITTRNRNMYWFQNNKIIRWDEGEQRRYLRTRDGMYANRKDSIDMDLVTSPSRGTLVGVEYRGGGRDDLGRICIFKNNQWTVAHEIDGWNGRDGSDPICLWTLDESTMIVGTKRGVRIINDGNLTQPLVNIAGYDINVPIVAVWGQDITHYYTLDVKGNIIAYDGTRGRLIVRGPEINREKAGGVFTAHEKEAYFKSAWVSPDGIVFAATNEKVYCFE